MPSYQNFEELPIWQRSRKLSIEIYQISNTGPLSKDYGFREQLRRAAVSIMNNTAEGFERKPNKEFINFLNIAKTSTGEVRSMLILANDLEYISDSKF